MLQNEKENSKSVARTLKLARNKWERSKNILTKYFQLIKHVVDLRK